MSSRTHRTLALASGGLTLIAGAAVASTPSSGTIGNASPKTEWSGQVYASFFANAAAGGESDPCAPGGCDAFALKVADPGDVTISADAPKPTAGASEATVYLRVRKPDGSVALTSGAASPEKPLKFKLKGAKAGDYTVEYMSSYGNTNVYEASAELGVAAAPAPAPAPAPGPAPAPQPQPAAQDIAVDVKAPARLSAKKLSRARKLVVTVKVSREVSRIDAVLKKGSKTVGRGSLGRASGTQRLTLKLARLKAGTYSLSVAATEGATTGQKTIKVKIRK